MIKQRIRLSRWTSLPARTLGQAKYWVVIGQQSSEAGIAIRAALSYVLTEKQWKVNSWNKDGSWWKQEYEKEHHQEAKEDAR